MTASADHAPDSHASAAAPSRDGLPAGTLDRPATARAGARARAVAAVRGAPVHQRFLWVLLLLFVAKGVIFTYVFPPFTGHDEVAHYGYLNILMTEGRLPLIPDPVEYNRAYTDGENPTFDQIPDYFQRYQRYTTADWWNDNNRVVRTVTYMGNYLPSGWVYVANHPPLYYLLVAPVWSVTADQTPEFQLYALRLAAIPLGLLTVLFAYLTVRKLFPRDSFLAMTVPTFVAFQPQIAYEAAMLNNDILAIATTSAVLYLIAAGLRNRFTTGLVAWLGLALGLAVLSKSTAVIVMPAIALAMILRIGPRNIAEWLPKGALVLGLTALLAAPWYLYMLVTYGSASALDRIQTLQWWNNQDGVTRSITDQLTDGDFAWLRWKETWGEFGWRLIPLDDALLRVVLFATILTFVGLAVWGVLVALLRWRLRRASLGEQRSLARATDPVVAVAGWQLTGVLAMVLTVVLAYYAVLQFGKEFDLTQARYYFPAVNAGALLMMLGLRTLTPARWQPWVQTAVFVGMLVLNVLILSSYVIPYWEAVTA